MILYYLRGLDDDIENGWQVLMKSLHGYVITYPVKCGMKLLIHSQTSIVQPLKFGNG